MKNLPPRSGDLRARLSAASGGRNGGDAPQDTAIASRRYRPYPRQAEFHAAGAAHRERLFLAGNQLGKTLAGANELAMGLGALRSLEKIKRAG